MANIFENGISSRGQESKTRRYSKWHDEPLYSQLQRAIRAVRFENKSVNEACRESFPWKDCAVPVPSRTLRRYIAMSRDEPGTTFYMPGNDRLIRRAVKTKADWAETKTNSASTASTAASTPKRARHHSPKTVKYKRKPQNYLERDSTFAFYENDVNTQVCVDPCFFSTPSPRGQMDVCDGQMYVYGNENSLAQGKCTTPIGAINCVPATIPPPLCRDSSNSSQISLCSNFSFGSFDAAMLECNTSNDDMPFTNYNQSHCDPTEQLSLSPLSIGSSEDFGVDLEKL